MPMAMEDCCSEAVPQDQARLSLRRPSVSILEALKAPKASDPTRKRKVDCNPPGFLSGFYVRGGK